MQRAGEARPGTMSALLGVGADDAAGPVRRGPRRRRALVANGTRREQSVISGSVAAIERAEAIAAGRQIRAVRLNVAGAFHSPLMEPAVGPIADEIARPSSPRRTSRSRRT